LDINMYGWISYSYGKFVVKLLFVHFCKCWCCIVCCFEPGWPSSNFTKNGLWSYISTLCKQMLVVYIAGSVLKFELVVDYCNFERVLQLRECCQ